jgi:putative flavoprotein involved in K+ transport
MLSIERYPVIIVGAGQAGLALSHDLTKRGVRHLLLERHTLGYAWREQRWDSFCLVTPNWQCQLPGHPYAGDDPNGFMLKHQIVDYVLAYAASFEAPVRERVNVLRVRERAAGGFSLETSSGLFEADQVVLASGPYHRPNVLPLAAALPETLQLNALQYRNAQSLPEGPVLVVGSGQSGCQIAEDLHLAGREVHLCVGSAPRVARRYRGQDVVAWLSQMGHYDLGIDRHPDGLAVRSKKNHYVTGRDGGRDIDLRKFASEGMHLHGRLLGVDADGFSFGDDLAQNLDRADATSERIKDGIDAYIERERIAAPTEARYSPCWQPRDEARRLPRAQARFGSVIWCSGFKLDYSFVELPAFDAGGYPLHTRGVIDAVPGLYVLGLPWLYTWGSGRFYGVGRDAQHVAEVIHARQRGRARARAS